MTNAVDELALAQVSGPGVRDRLLTTAVRLFYAEGVGAVGIDRLLAEAAVAKASLYLHFASKRQLVAAYLQLHDEAWRSWFSIQVSGGARRPPQRLLAAVDALGLLVAADGFRGCGFANAVAEVGHRWPEVAAIACEHKARVSDFLAEVAAEGKLRSPRRVGLAMVTIMDGTLAAAQRQPSAEAVLGGRIAAEALIRAHSRPRGVATSP